MGLLEDVLAPSPRAVVVHSPRPVDEALAILEYLISSRGHAMAPRRLMGVRLLDGAIVGSRVSFTAVPASNSAILGMRREPPALEFTGSVDEMDDGSVLNGSIRAPMALGIPAIGITLLFALFLVWNGIAPVLIAIGVLAWIFVTAIVVVSLEEQRLGEADVIRRYLEAALA